MEGDVIDCLGHGWQFDRGHLAASQFSWIWRMATCDRKNDGSRAVANWVANC